MNFLFREDGNTGMRWSNRLMNSRGTTFGFKSLVPLMFTQENL